jgi:hypothetical protein
MAVDRYRAMLKFMRESTGATPGNVLYETFYPPGTEWNTYQKDISNFNKWLEREYGVIAQSTAGYKLYDAAVVRDYRRKKK